ncbi:MAG: dihydropteroate synthase [Bacteroidetes bacterium]|nr:dihydropteroate synthase [Bacteroidota bacterium]
MLNPRLTLNCGGTLLSLEDPLIMGILNITPDSFYDGGKYEDEKSILGQVETMLREGATIIDIGGMSSRPGAKTISADEELQRVLPYIRAIKKHFPEAILSLDTFRANVAKAGVEEGVQMINDISAGQMDPAMFDILPKLNVPYVLMHMQGIPENMQQQPGYEDVITEVLDFFIEKSEALKNAGQKDIILDVGFGFGKTLEHNYTLLKNMHAFQILDWPLLAGISRKSMIYKLLDTTPQEALNGTSALHMIALQQGAKILRVHDVKEAKEVIELWKF